ncbi:11895_t:CDS:2, partial [Entrophospora sp. SA101]
INDDDASTKKGYYSEKDVAKDYKALVNDDVRNDIVRFESRKYE